MKPFLSLKLEVKYLDQTSGVYEQKITEEVDLQKRVFVHCPVEPLADRPIKREQNIKLFIFVYVCLCLPGKCCG